MQPTKTRLVHEKKRLHTHPAEQGVKKKHVQMFTYTSSAVTAEVNSSDGIRALFFSQTQINSRFSRQWKIHIFT